MSIVLIMSCYTGFFNVRRGWRSLDVKHQSINQSINLFTAPHLYLQTFLFSWFSVLLHQLNWLPRYNCLRFRVRVMVFNATFNNISVISWRSFCILHKCTHRLWLMGFYATILKLQCISWGCRGCDRMVIRWGKSCERVSKSNQIWWQMVKITKVQYSNV
jgi:hypothetical protein